MEEMALKRLFNLAGFENNVKRNITFLPPKRGSGHHGVSQQGPRNCHSNSGVALKNIIYLVADEQKKAPIRSKNGPQRKPLSKMGISEL